MTRPDHLPDFEDPPLDEVVVGVQFTPVPTYKSVNSSEIWKLFKGEFPKVEEHPLLDPKFETFGGITPQPGVQFRVGARPVGSRLWFVSAHETHLLQFQPDRFIINWRKRKDPQTYPRFEGIADAFKKNIEALAKHFAAHFNYTIDINQAEVAYINIIPVEEFSEVGKWFTIWKNGALNIEALNTSFNEIISDSGENQFARLTHEIQSVFAVDGKQKAFKLSLTFRGRPFGNDITSAMSFFEIGREKIVTRFDEITTPEAHKFWRKLK